MVPFQWTLDIYKISVTLTYMTKTQTNIITVLDRLTKLVKDDAVQIEILSESMEGMLNDLRSNDFFGTEGQLDPRGDGRNGDFSMTRIGK